MKKVCNYCTRKFKTKQGLSLHIRRSHPTGSGKGILDAEKNRKSPEYYKIYNEGLQEGQKLGREVGIKEEWGKIDKFIALVRERTAISSAIAIYTFIERQKENENKKHLAHHPSGFIGEKSYHEVVKK